MLDRSRNYNTLEGANALAGHIVQFWAQRNRFARVRVVPDSAMRDSKDNYVVRSTMTGGWP